MKNRVKKLLALTLCFALILTLVFSFSSCTQKSEGGTSGESKAPTDAKNDIALITDVGTIDDRSFNQGAWEGVVKYAKEKNITHKYYKPTEKTDDAYMASIDLAVKDGAKIVVTPGFLFEKTIFMAQDKYKDVKFILLDGAPHAGDYKTRIEKNVLSIFYAEEQAGFLAGYAAVKEGYRKLGFMGGMAVPAVIRFGYGFVQGADYAAKELGLAKDAVTCKYKYVGNFNATPDNQALAAAWYNDGAEVIFACGGAVGNSVMAAAEALKDKKVIGVDVDQSGESATVISSSMKELGKSVYDAIASIYDNKFEGGKSIIYDVKVNGVALPMATSKFTKFDKAQYDAIYKNLVDNTNDIAKNIKKDSDAKTAKDLAPSFVKVDLIA